MQLNTPATALGILFALTALRAEAQHLWWDESYGQKDATCVYGEITVLATHHGVYYCGANWHPGEPAGGYCGIQHNSPQERRTLFSIWDTSPGLRPRVTQADSKTSFNRFGGEGEGAHTHMRWNWQAGVTFQFFVRKEAGTAPGTTAARYYIYDVDAQKWRHSATIESPNGDKKSEASAATFGGGGLSSFLENFTGKDRNVAKLALYRLWLGTDVWNMKCLTQVSGDGTWGQLHDAYFLAEGGQNELAALFLGLQEKYGKPVFGQDGKKLSSISNKPLSEALKAELRTLPVAGAVHQ